MYNTTWPHLFWKIFVNFLTSTLLRVQNTTLLSKVRRRFFSNFVAFSENPNFIYIRNSRQLILTLYTNKLYQLKPLLQSHTKFVLSSTKLEVIVKICLFSPRGEVNIICRQKPLRFLENPKLYPVSTISCESFWHILVEYWLVIAYILTFELWY